MAKKFRLASGEEDRAEKLLNTMNQLSGSKEDIEQRKIAERQRANELFNQTLPVKTGYDNNNNRLLPTNNFGNLNLQNTSSNQLPMASNIDLGKFIQTKQFDDGYQFGDISKTWLGTGLDVTQNFAKGFINPIENVLDIGANAVASVQDVLGFDNEAKDVRNFANRDLSTTISKRASQSTPFGVAYNIWNGTPDRIINPAGIEINTNKSLGENIGNAFNKIYNDDNTENISSYQKASLSGDIPDKLVELFGYSTGLSMYGQALGNIGKTAEIGSKTLGATANAGNIGINIAGHTLNLPTLAAAGGGAEALQEANSKENVTELERWTKFLTGAGIESFTEGLFGLMGVGGNDITDQLASKLTKKCSTSIGKLMTKFGIQASGEGAEEILSYIANFLVDNGLINKLGKADFSKDFDVGEMIENAALAAISAAGGSGSTIMTNNYATKAAEQQLGRPLTMQEKAQITQAVIDENVNERLQKLAKEQNQQNLPTQNKNVAPNQTENAQQQVQQQTTLPMQKMAQNQTSEQIMPTNKNIVENLKNQAENHIKEADISEYDRKMMLDTLNNMQEFTASDYRDLTNMLSEMQATQVDTSNMNFEDVVDNAMSMRNYEIPSPLQDRNINTIGKETKVNAYQYDNPEVKPYYEKMAQVLKEDIANISDKMNRTVVKNKGTQLNTMTSAVNELHNNLGYSYNDIVKGLDNIIEDHGAENNALSKKIEIVIDGMLRNGYTTSQKQYIEANDDYINLINKGQTPINTQNTLPTTEQNNLIEQSNKLSDNEAQNMDKETLLPTSENQKFRKHYKSVIESNYTTDEAKKISKQLMNSDTYVPESNTKQLERADTRIEQAGADSELNSLLSRAMTGGNIKADDIAVGERLIQYYSKTGNKAKLQEAIQATAMAGTTAGQTVQAMSLLNHQTPEGQAVWLQRSVEKMNNDLKKRRGQNAEQFNLTPEMTEKIVNSNNAEELQKNLNEVYDELGQQVSKSTIEKLDAWRYFSMLANPKTHIRNIVGNIAMGKVQGVKNKIAGAIEGTIAQFNPNMERTRTLKRASKEVKQFAKNDIKNVADRLELNDNKYNPKTRLENSMRTFKSNALENTLGKLFEFNNKALEVEDAWGLKSAYTRSLSEYMTANKLTPDTITDKQLAKARNFAIEQAKEATFHQASALATAINQFSNKNGLTKFVADSVVPFKKTPINVAKAGLEYSPAGLAKSAIYDTVQLRKGNITVNQYIDNISKGLTGSGIALLGYALAEAGILKASGGDDDKEKYDQDRGMQTYSIQIGDNTYSLDWLAPVGIPLFIGAEVHNIMKKDEETKTSTSSDDDKVYNQAIKSATNILDAFTNAMNPMTEMSMLSGLTSALKSYDGDNAKMLANLGVNTSKSYVNQFVPTALGQVAKTTDEYERSTTSTQTGTLPKAIDSTKNQIMAKIPGLRQMLPTKTDVWGNDLKQSENVVQRALENAVLPFVRKEIQNSEVDKELTRLYDSTGESGILPDSINKNLTINKEKYVMTSDEYAKYKKQYGQTAYDLIDNLVTSKDYKNMTDEQKTTAIENIYKYANEQIKDDYAKENNLDYELSTMSNVANKLNKSDKDDYFEFTAKTKDMSKDTEKIQTLANSNYSNKVKETIYENSFGKNDSLYDTMKLAGTDINEYLKYKTQEFTSDKEDDGTTTGKSVSGSKKAKVVDYVQNMNITNDQKLLLLATQYSLTSSEKSRVANYVKGLNTTKANKLKIYESLSGFTVYKDGRVTW